LAYGRRFFRFVLLAISRETVMARSVTAERGREETVGLSGGKGSGDLAGDVGLLEEQAVAVVGFSDVRSVE
jgi:hypothetical protein